MRAANWAIRLVFPGGKRQGTIEIGDRSSYVEVPETLADDIIAALKATTIRGKKVLVRRDSKA